MFGLSHGKQTKEVRPTETGEKYCDQHVCLSVCMYTTSQKR